VTTYAADGFLHRPGLLPSATVRRLVAIGERVHAGWLAAHGDDVRRLGLVNGTRLTDVRWFAPPYDDERAVFFDALADPVLYDVVTESFGADLYFHGTQAFFSPLGERAPYWHRDLQYGSLDEAAQRRLLSELTQLHVRIPLRPERRFLLVPGSHARWDTTEERDVRLERDGHRSAEELSTARSFDLVPGDVLVFSAHMLHRGTYGQDRLSLDLMVGRPHATSAAFPDTAQLPTPAELARIRRPQWYRAAAIRASS